jgi:tyrosyl-tRNA synthetase
MALAELTRNAVDLLPAGGLEEKLKLGRPLRVKLGIDVTSPDIHVGRAIPLQRMRAFQDEGHTGVLIIGDYTTRIGDPSGRSAERPILSDEEIDRNARTYLEQAMVILDRDRTEVRYNGEWLAGLTFAELVALARTITVARILERDDFTKRMKAQEPISISELLYPLVQAYDSVAVEADVELGGTDQLYNLLAGREVMPHYGLEPQVVLTTPLLLSWDGTKMSSSKGNNVPLTAPPEEMFGRTMRISDDQLDEWYRLVMERPAPTGDPLEAKLALARFVVARSHGEEGVRAAEEHFTRVVRNRARRRSRDPASGRGSRTPAGAPRRADGGRVDLRGAPPHRAGRREGERRARAGPRRGPGSPRRGAPPGGEAPFRAVDTLGRLAILPKPSMRAVHESPCPRRLGAIRPDSYPIRFDCSVGLWRESEAFLRRQSDGAGL